MTAADLKIGMYLTNDGQNAIPLYDSPDGTGTVALSIQPGALIGQIVDFSTGPAGVTVAFTSAAIYATGTTTEKIVNWVLQIVPDAVFKASPALMANFTDIAANVSAKQVADQNGAIATSEDQGASLKNTAKQNLKDIAGAAASIFGNWSMWELIGIFGLSYVLLNWNTFFKPAKTR